MGGDRQAMDVSDTHLIETTEAPQMFRRKS